MTNQPHRMKLLVFQKETQPVKAAKQIGVNKKPRKFKIVRDIADKHEHNRMHDTD